MVETLEAMDDPLEAKRDPAMFDQMLFELLTEIIPDGLVQDHAPGTEKLDRLRAIVCKYIIHVAKPMEAEDA